MARPRITLPTSGALNEVMTLVLKEFGPKYVLWMIDSFTRFIAITDTWCMNFGFLSGGFFADNSGEFPNIQLDELTSILRLSSVKFGPSSSSWSNSLNQRNHASADITIKTLMEEHKVSLSDSLMKAAAWTHNTLVNKLGYSPLQLVTRQAVTVPGLTTGNEGTDIIKDSEAVRRKMENFMHENYIQVL